MRLCPPLRESPANGLGLLRSTFVDRSRWVCIVILAMLPLEPVVHVLPANSPNFERPRAGLEPRERQPLLAGQALALGDPGQARNRFTAPGNQNLATFFHLRYVTGQMLVGFTQAYLLFAIEGTRALSHTGIVGRLHSGSISRRIDSEGPRSSLDRRGLGSGFVTSQNRLVEVDDRSGHQPGFFRGKEGHRPRDFVDLQ
jgi:hypothetical protein